MELAGAASAANHFGVLRSGAGSYALGTRTERPIGRKPVVIFSGAQKKVPQNRPPATLAVFPVCWGKALDSADAYAKSFGGAFLRMPLGYCPGPHPQSRADSEM
jgi:hypothetical protein